MSSDELILDWINNELKLEPKVVNITKEFSNGYRFAEVLHALKEITSNELKEFKNTKNIKEMKINFQKIKKYLHEKLKLDIREEEFNDIIENSITKATIVLYKIKNSIVKKNINFLEIKTFPHKPTNEEIHSKVKDILDNEIREEIDKDEDENEQMHQKTRNNRYYIRKITHNSVDLKSIESDSNDNESNKNIKETQFGNMNASNSNISKKTKSNNLSIYNANNTINTNKTFESKIGHKLALKEMEAMENSINSKKSYKPFPTNFNFKTINNNKTSILPKILPKVNINSNYEYKSSIMNSNIGKLSNYTLFNQKIQKINFQTVGNTLSVRGNDFNNDFGMTKIKELKNKILMKKKLDELKNSEEIKNELRLKREYEVKEKYQLDFVNKIKNPLYKFTKFTGVNLFMHSNSKYNSCNKRLEYSKELKEKKHKEEFEQQLSCINKIMNTNTETMNPSLKEIYKKLNIGINSSNSGLFNRRKYFKKLDTINKDEFNKLLTEKYNKDKEDYPIIKNVVYSIIELMEDIYDYQEEKEKQTIDLEDFKTFSELFINNKNKHKDTLDNEDLLIKKSESLDNINNIRQIDINTLVLKEDEKYLIDDYINYIGIWNDEKIINNELKGYKYDIKKIKVDLPSDYEPTENDIEDITLPIRISDNYTLGNTILNLIDTKFSNNKDNEVIRDSINKENSNISKWNYIPYKLSLIGYPLSGRKFIAENLNKKYPNIKIYSIKKIFRDYYIEYKNLTEQIDSNPKYKALKPNQLTQMKEEREKQLSEFTPILNIIKPFIDFLNEEKIRRRLEEEERIRKEKEKEREKEKEEKLKNDTKGNKKGAKSPKRRASKSKNQKKVAEEVEVKEENINDDLCKIPSDEVLFNLLKYKIEKDFPKKSKEESDKEIIENQKKMFQIIKNIETLKKQKKEAIKPNPKDDIAINNLQKDLDNMKLESIKGFILVDYPCNINQGVLLENYLTGYVDEIKKPKSEKNKIINNLSNLLDFKIIPKKNNVFKKAGIDFVINLINQEKDINERFQTKKYDPVSDKIYTSSDLSDDNKNKQPLDKKIIERLVNDVPYLSNENFEYYKNEYNNNVSLISSLYNKFGMYVDVSTAQDTEINILGMDFSEKELKKSFQSIELDTNTNNINENINNNELKSVSVKKSEDGKRSSVKKKSKKKNDNSENSMTAFDIEEKNKNKILDFISNNLINWLYKEKDKSDKVIFYSHHPEYNTDEENDRIKFDPDLKVNEINNDKGKKTFKPQSNNSSILMGESRITTLLNKNSEYIIKDLINFNQNYYKYLGRFIYLINIQKNKIYQRLNLYQKKFRDFLNRQSNKKKVIHLYVMKYNEFFRDKPNFFLSKKAIEEFSKDIEEVNNNLWILINEKEKDSIKELNNIKTCGFIEKELEYFYENIKELTIVETEKFLKMINSIIYLYSNNTKNNINKKDDNSSFFQRSTARKKTNKNKSKDLNNINEKINEKETNLINEINFDKSYVTKNISTIIFDPKETTNSFNNTTNNIYMKNPSNKLRKESKNEIKVNNLISQISNNIEVIFLNSIKLILEYQEIIDKLIKEIKSTSNITHKKIFKRKTTKYNFSSNNSSMMTSMYGGENQINEIIVKMLQNEKNRYKYRMCYIKSFAYKYMAIITQTAQNIYYNLDQWIVTSVSLQNDALNMIISILRKKLEDHKLINEKREINKIEMDEFEKIIDEEGAGSEIRLKPIDNSSVGIGRIYNKINIDYLINDNFIDIKVEEIINQNQNEDNNKYKFIKNDKNDKNENKRYKMILPNELDRSINSSINNSFGGIKNRFKEFDFYYDINKFNIIYKNVKKYEIEENIISKDLFYDVFIKENLIDKYGENDNEKENINLVNNMNSINKINDNRNNNNEFNESEEDENENKIYINENLINNQNNIHNLTGICTALRMLNTKQFHKIYNLYQIPVEHKTSLSTNIEQKEIPKENTKEENKENKENKDHILNNSENNNNINNKESIEIENNEVQKIEYETYLNTSEIFTILPLIGCRIMNLMEEENIYKDLKEKLIRGKYLSMKDFMEYHFWFEQEFEYQNEDIMFQQMLEENNSNSNSKINLNSSGKKNNKSNNNLGLNVDNKNKKINIKEFLFNIWKDEKGDKMDFQQFMSVLKINKYITDLNGLNEENYYNLIFKNES